MSFFARRPSVACALALGVGCWLGVTFVPMPIWTLVGMAFACVLCVILRLSGKSMLPGLFCFLLFTALFLGGRAVSPVLPSVGDYSFTAVVHGDAEVRQDGGVRCYLSDVHADGAPLGQAYWTYIPDRDAPQPLPIDGQRVAFSGRIYHPSGQTNPFGFDFHRYLLWKGVMFGIYGADALLIEESEHLSLDNAIYAFRKRVGLRLDALLGEEGQLARALLLGDRSDMPDETREWFARAGIAHILSVSGLHVGMLMACFMRMLSPIRLSPRCTLWIMSVVMLVYCAFLSFQTPVVRASILLFCVLLAQTLRRRPDPLSTLSLAFSLIILANPLELFAAGFQLSFSAVLGIVLLGDRFRPLIRRVRASWKRRLASDYLTCLNATIGVLLPSCAHFGQFSIIGLIVNPLACIAVAPTMIGCLGVLMASLVSMPLARLLAFPVQFLLRLYLLMARTFAEIPFATVPAPYPPLPTALAILVGVIMLTRFIRASVRTRAVVMVLAAIIALTATQVMCNRDVRYTQLSVGNADAAIIEDGDITFVVDAGENGGDLANYLLAHNRRVDVLFLTHLHVDHMRGLTQLLDGHVRILRIVLPEGGTEMDISDEFITLLARARSAGIEVTEVARGDKFTSERVTIEAVWPVSGTMRAGCNANDYSLALLCDLDGVTLLTTGDLTGVYERYAAIRADLLKVAHHGSNSSSTEGFLAAVSPSVAILSTSGRQYMPSDALLQRLDGIDIFRTDLQGAIITTVVGGRAEITHFLP